MNYRHSFHAGNFTDVFKHIFIARILLYLCLKDSPFRVIDTHAGEGAYDLYSEEANRTFEWWEGIGRLSDLKNIDGNLLSLIQHYLACVGIDDKNQSLAYYPGSPMIALRLISPQDRAIFANYIPNPQVGLDTDLPVISALRLCILMAILDLALLFRQRKDADWF